MKAVLVLLNVLIIPLIIGGINLPLTKDTEDDICTFDDDICSNGGDSHNGGDRGNDGDSRTISNGRRSRRIRRSHGIKTSRYSPATSLSGSVIRST